MASAFRRVGTVASWGDKALDHRAVSFLGVGPAHTTVNLKKIEEKNSFGGRLNFRHLFVNLHSLSQKHKYYR